jgi:hypothetical protein
MAIKPNRMEFAQLRTKPSYLNDAKKISGIFFDASRKNENAARSSGVHIL